MINEFQKGMDPANIAKWKDYDEYLDYVLKKYNLTHQDFWDYYIDRLHQSADSEDLLITILDLAQMIPFKEAHKYFNFALEDFVPITEDEKEK